MIVYLKSKTILPKHYVKSIAMRMSSSHLHCGSLISCSLLLITWTTTPSRTLLNLHSMVQPFLLFKSPRMNHLNNQYFSIRRIQVKVKQLPHYPNRTQRLCQQKIANQNRLTETLHLQSLNVLRKIQKSSPG